MKLIFLFEKIIEQRTSAHLSLGSSFVHKVEKPRIVSYYPAGVGHLVHSRWKLHPEKKPAKLVAMPVEPSLISEVNSMLEESQRRIPDVKGVVKVL